jgi:hypothetical protein
VCHWAVVTVLWWLLTKSIVVAFLQVIKCIETEDIATEHGVPFQIFYGISGNDHGFWSIANARKIIGYEPEDNSAIRFADDISAHVTAAQAAKL